MNRNFRLRGILIGLCALGVTGEAAARIGIEAAGGVNYSASPYIQTKGNEFRNGNGFSARLSLILGNWFLSYDYTGLGNGKICSADCFASESFGSTKLHTFTANYNFYFTKGAFRPFLLAGFGAVIGTTGDWPSSSSSKIFGGDLRAGFGFEIPIKNRFFVRIEGRYRYIITNNPFSDPQTELTLALFLGTSVADTARDLVQDAHIVQATVGIGAHF